MELDITQFVADECPRDYQASIAEIGQGAGRATWQAAVECDHMFVTKTNRQEFIDHFKRYGAWTESEMLQWSLTELNALVVQEISSQMRDYSDAPTAEWDWNDYQRQSEAGQIGGRLFHTDDGKTYCEFGF